MSDVASNRPSIGSMDANDDLNGDLNDDLMSESAYSSFSSQQKQNRSGSFRNSIDADSSFSSSAFLHAYNHEDVDGNAPLGPNCIYDLTYGSDQARASRNRAPKTSVTINGGSTTVVNLRTPTSRDIKQIQLSKLKAKAKDSELQRYLESEKDYAAFESSYNSLTEDSLQMLAGLSSDKDSSNTTDHMSNIPQVFRESEFHLDNPRVFRQVIGDSTVVDIQESSGFIDNPELQNKLSHYLDIVEVNLVKEISSASNSFFSTIGDIQDIHTQFNTSTGQFRTIVEKLEQLETDQAHLGASIVDKIIRRRNVERLESLVLQVQLVTKILDVAHHDYRAGHHAQCLERVAEIEKLVAASPQSEYSASFPHPLVPLTDLAGLGDVNRQLHDLKAECSRGFVDRFVEILMVDLRDHYSRVPLDDTYERISSSISSKRTHRPINRSFQTLEETTKNQLAQFVQILSKSGYLVDAFTQYQAKVVVEIKDIIKAKLPTKNDNTPSDSTAPSRASSVPPENSNTPSSLSSHLRSMSDQEFESMLRTVFANLSECLRRLSAHQKLLLDLALTAIAPDTSSSLDVTTFDITSTINKAIELTQIRMAKVINVRSEQLADLSLERYLRFYGLASAYLQECELINPGYVASNAGSSLNEWIKNHTTYFVHRFHSNTLRNLIAECDKDQWKEVTAASTLSQTQDLVNELIEHAKYVESDGASGFSGATWLQALSVVPEPSETSPQIREDIAKIEIGNESFFVPDLACSSITHIRDYLAIQKVFSSRNSTVENNLLNYFKLMNSRASQAVLNAGATRTAGLKHIKTKHLAVCLQFIEYNIALLEACEPLFHRTRASAQPPNSEELTYERVVGNYKDHENELFSKLVSIMHDRTLNHCAAIVKINWAEPLKPPQQCHSYMETLVKETLIVAKALSKYLPEIKYSFVMSQIFDNYKKLLVNCYCTKLPQFKDFNEKHSLLKDIDYFRVKMSELSGYGNSGQVIWENVNSLPTIEDTHMDEIMKHNIEGEQRPQSAEPVAEKKVSNEELFDVSKELENE
ncbi:Vacuolar protein sorting-associated protein 54 [Meyerozyma sp. JA9]|nr:Vacuolar protein sorting-associated protein 54 [Meyerozyma sp. JA9]